MEKCNNKLISILCSIIPEYTLICNIPYNYKEVVHKMFAKISKIAKLQKKIEKEQIKKTTKCKAFKKENKRRIIVLEDLFTSQLGKLVETLLSPECKKYLRKELHILTKTAITQNYNRG